MEVQERLDGRLLVLYQDRIIPTQEALPHPGALRTLNGAHADGLADLKRLQEGVNTYGVQASQRERLGALGVANHGGEEVVVDSLPRNRSTGVRKPPAAPPRQPTPRQKARWDAVQKAQRRGLSLRAIAREMGISRNTVRKYVVAKSPTMGARGPKVRVVIRSRGALTISLWISGQVRRAVHLSTGQPPPGFGG